MKNQKGFIQVPLLIIIIGGILFLSGGGYYGVKQYQNYQAKQVEKEKIAEEKEKQLQELLEKQQETLNKTIEDAKIKSEIETNELKNEIESLKSQTTKQTQNQQQSDKKILELKEELNSSTALNNENYDEQSNVVLDSIAKVVCFLNRDKTISGSGSVWGVGDNYYLVTNKHVLEEADREDESCAISIARDWNAVADDFEKAYQDDNLLVYNLDLNYTYWEIDGFDFAITKIIEYEQPLSFLDDIAMETNETECHENLRVGEKIKIIGFPYTSSFALPTITEGIISSFENIGDTNYYITSAKIEHGNSGGIAVTNNYYCMIGIPTAVVVGDSESLGRILVLTEEDLKILFDNI